MKADDACVCACLSLSVCVCGRVSHVSTCELVSSQGHLVIPQAYQGQRTHKYQRQMPHTQQQLCEMSLSFSLTLSLSLSHCDCLCRSVCHAVFVCMEFLTSLSGRRLPICRYASLLNVVLALPRLDRPCLIVLLGGALLNIFCDARAQWHAYLMPTDVHAGDDTSNAHLRHHSLQHPAASRGIACHSFP